MLAKFGRSISEMKRISPLLLPLILWLTLKAMRVPTAPSRLWALRRVSDVTPLEYRRPDLPISPARYVGYALCMQVLFEADIDDDRKLSASEFSHVITKSPDFITTFHFRI